MRINTNAFLAASILMFTVFSSCKKLEQSIKRDVIIVPAAVPFTIPEIENTNTGQVAGIFASTIDLEAEVRRLTEEEFGRNNIQHIKLSSITIDLVDSPAVAENNLGNFEYFTIKMISGQNQAVVADIQNHPSGASRSYIFANPETPANLKEILDAGTFNYDIRVKARTPTTKVLEAFITPTYIVSLSF